jgi:hypothetical protein
LRQPEDSSSFPKIPGLDNTQPLPIKWRGEDSGGLSQQGIAAASHFATATEPFRPAPVRCLESRALRAGVEEHMNGIIYLIGLIVVILAILSFLGLR